MPKLRVPMAVAACLAMAASTALHFQYWRREMADSDSSGMSRKLIPVSVGRHESGALHESAPRGIFQVGHGLAKMLQNRMPMRAKKLSEANEREARLLRENLTDIKQVWLRGFHHKSTWYRYKEVKAAEEAAGETAEKHKLKKLEDDYEPFTVCGRPADVGSTEDFESLQKYALCPEITQDRPIILLDGTLSYGGTGHNLVEFLHAIQEARDFDLQLGIKAGSWVMQLLTKMWMSIKDNDWGEQFERAFCVKVFYTNAQLEGWNVIHQDPKELLRYKSEAPLGEYMKSQEYSIRTLFRNYNTGDGVDMRGGRVADMCSGVDAIFGEDGRSAIYSVIHSLTMEGRAGFKSLRNVARTSGCDPVAAMEMNPEYIKAILEPLGMMDYPIVFISDSQNHKVLDRLMADPEIGTSIRVLPEEAYWPGGALTLGVMSNVYIGNPASTISGFIAKARLALGFGHNYLFRKKDAMGQWKTSCGDHCIFDTSILGVMA